MFSTDRQWLLGRQRLPTAPEEPGGNHQAAAEQDQVETVRLSSMALGRMAAGNTVW